MLEQAPDSAPVRIGEVIAAITESHEKSHGQEGRELTINDCVEGTAYWCSWCGKYLANEWHPEHRTRGAAHELRVDRDRRTRVLFAVLAEVARQDANPYPWTPEMLAGRTTMYRHETKNHAIELVNAAAWYIREAIRLNAGAA